MKVKINTHGNKMPECHGEFIDLATTEEATMTTLEHKLIPLGISMELPDGYYAEVFPRSSTCKKWGIILANSIGIIDHDYCGDNDIWHFPAVAIRDTTIPSGTRICQFRLVKKAEPIEFEQVEYLGNQDRGGLGSTGER